jgi:hypothetical protein
LSFYLPGFFRPFGDWHGFIFERQASDFTYTPFLFLSVEDVLNKKAGY